MNAEEVREIVMLPSEKIELALYRFVERLAPQAASASITHLSQLTGETDYGRIIERLKDLEAHDRVFLSKHDGRGQVRQYARDISDGEFFYRDSFFIKIATRGRKYFEALEQKAEEEGKPMTSRKTPVSNAPLVSPKKAAEILRTLIHNASFLSGEPFGSPKREEWTTTAEGVLTRSFAPGTPILNGFSKAQSIAFSSESSEEELRGVANNNLASQVAVLKSATEQLGWELGEAEATPVKQTRETTTTSLPIFISHSSKDVDLAAALIDLLRLALGLTPSQIRCTSVDGYRLPVGVNTESELREEVNAAKVLVALVTPNSLMSPFVMFELGARWGAKLFLAPLLAGVNPSGLSAPLSLLNVLSANNEAQLYQLLEDISKQLESSLQSASSCSRHVSAVKRLADSISQPPPTAESGR